MIPPSPRADDGCRARSTEPVVVDGGAPEEPTTPERPETGRVGPLRVNDPEGASTAPLESPTVIDTAVAGLDAWFETIRGSGGYGGPVVHWWRHNLLYVGAGLDWRYEGIIAGYVHLWERTGQEVWLRKATRAGDDLVRQQLESGHYPASAFELNPATAGTPHEAAADVGLLTLARALREAERPGWERYVGAAEQNLQKFYVNTLWDSNAHAFRDHPRLASFVPNKAATACEAMFLLSELTGDDRWATLYALPTIRKIIAFQVHDRSRFDGAIAQNSIGTRRIEKYFPIYIARCVPALVRAFRWTRDEMCIDSALRALGFIARWAYADGSLPTVVYPTGHVADCPRWIAPLGDILRAADELAPYGFTGDLTATRYWLLAGRDDSGGIQTAVGFAGEEGGKPRGAPDVRDVLHVAGWCDKAFRYLAAHVSSWLPPFESRPVEITCTLRGRHLRLTETMRSVEIVRNGQVSYQWRKGETWAQTFSDDFWAP